MGGHRSVCTWNPAGPTFGKDPSKTGRNADLRVSLTFGSQRWNQIRFVEAAQVVETYLTAEHRACVRLVQQINRDYWITSFWSEVLGGARPPTHADWIIPLNTLSSARSAHRGGNDAMARTHLQQAVAQYNEVHKKWIAYRDRLDAGARRSITTIEISIVVLSSVASVGHGASVAAQGTRILGGAMTVPARAAALKGATMAAGLAGGTSAAKQAGLVAHGVEEKFDVAQVVLDTTMAFVTSLIGGKLAQKFLGLMSPRVAAAMTFDRAIVEAARQARVLLPSSYSLSQKMLAEFLGGFATNLVAEAAKVAATKAKGKNLRMEQLIVLVAQEVSKEGLTTALKAYFASKGG